jgi:hypothetical protein
VFESKWLIKKLVITKRISKSDLAGKWTKLNKDTKILFDFFPIAPLVLGLCDQSIIHYAECIKLNVKAILSFSKFCDLFKWCQTH